MKISQETLHQLIENKLCQAGLKHEHTATMAEVLVYTNARGIHSHGTVHVEYYTEHISKGSTNHEPEFHLEETRPCSAILHANNATRQVTAKMGMEHAIKTTQQNGITVVSISQMGHSSTISYFVQQAAHARLIGISMCQSNPMVVPFGSTEIYYSTNPLAFATPGEGNKILTFDMATTIQAWGKVLNTHSRNMSIPDTWAVNKNSAPTTNPFTVHALLPTTRPKGYGLMMMIDILSGILLSLPFRLQVSSMYDNLHTRHNLGQLHIIINPNFFFSSKLFHQHLSQTMHELNAITPTPSFNQVYYPRQDQDIKQHKATIKGIKIVDDIYQYLISNTLYNTSYKTKNPFAQ